MSETQSETLDLPQTSTNSTECCTERMVAATTATTKLSRFVWPVQHSVWSKEVCRATTLAFDILFLQGSESTSPATQIAMYLHNGFPLNDFAGALKYWPWRAKRTPSLSNHFHLTIPRVHKMLYLPIKTTLIVKWIRF